MRRLWLLLPLGAIGCGKPTGPNAAGASADSTGVIAVQWAGARKGQFRAPAEAWWCAADSLIELFAVRGDSGVGITLVVPDSARTGQHPVVASSIPVGFRPLAFAALRWLSDSGVKGFEATGGKVLVNEVARRRLTGTIDVRLKASEGFDTLHLTGAFTRVRVDSTRAPCGRAFKPKNPTP